MVGDEKRGQGRKIWLGTKNMVGDEKYGWGRKIWSGTKKLEEKTDKKKKETKIWSKKTAALIITGQVGSYSKNYPVFTPLREFVKYAEWHCDLS